MRILRYLWLTFLVALFASSVQADRLTANTTPWERDQGARWADDFESQTLVEANGGTVTGSPTYSTHGTTGGVTLDGSNDDIVYDLSGDPFNSANLSFVAEFTPHTEYDDNNNRYLFSADTDGAGTSKTQVWKINNAGNNVLYLTLFGTNFAIASGTYSGYWAANERHVLVFSGTSGNSNAWLCNATGGGCSQILTADASVWTPASLVNHVVGARYDEAQKFDGVVHSLKIYKGSLLTSYDATAIYANTWNRPSLISTLQDAGDLVLYHDYRSGSLTDFSGQGNHGTGTDIAWQGRGIRYPETTSVVTVADAAELQGDEFALVVYGDFQSQVTTERMIHKRDAGGTNYSFYWTSTNIRLHDGTNDRLLAASVVGKHFVAINAKNGNTGEVFLDGLSAGSLSGASALSADDAPLLIGSYHGGGHQPQSPLHAALIVNRELTATEMMQLYTELKVMTWPRKTSGTGQGSYGAELVTDGDFELAGTANWPDTAGTMTKESGAAMAGDQVLRITKDGAGTDYTRQAVMTVGTTYRVTGWGRGDGTANPRAGGGDYHWTGTTSTAWQRIDFVETWSVTGFIYIYANGGAATNWVEFDNISAKEVQGNWIQYKTDYAAYAANTNVVAGFVENTDFLRSTGTHKITTDTVNGKTTKILECVAGGRVSIDARLLQGSATLDAYGTYEWWMYKTDATIAVVLFVADVIGAENAVGQDGYNVYIDAVERIYLRESTNGTPTSLFYTATSYADHSQWQKYRVTRRQSDGQFTVYLDDTLIDPAGGTGTNPVTDNTTTTSLYIVFELGAGDKISLGSTNGDENLWKAHGVIAP